MSHQDLRISSLRNNQLTVTAPHEVELLDAGASRAAAGSPARRVSRREGSDGGHGGDAAEVWTVRLFKSLEEDQHTGYLLASPLLVVQLYHEVRS